MKKKLYLIPCVLVCSTMYATPQSGEVAAGHVEFHSPNGRSLKIIASDKSIINYRQFNIAEGELVEFIQPSSKATVLNRITGGDPSKILGTLNANGRVFLVNPSGIYFGPNATVNAGSFLASTLNIRDEDFLNDKFRFYKEPGSEKSSIINEGSIAAGPEGFIAFFAPIIENHGTVLARAGKVILAAAEQVVLDFSGDGLIQFTVDGELKKALIENYGKIEAANGNVEISLRTARDAIKMVVNSDGITPANSIEESNGVIRLISKSSIAADKVLIEGGDSSKIDVQGKIDVASNDAKGGTVHLLGEQIQLIGAEVDASGATGGGTVLIGGDYQGKGGLRTAQNTVMDSASEIKADAYLNGDGGKVIIWADDTAIYDGLIYARGGSESGNGGFVETSGKENLSVTTGNVNTLSPKGQTGSWLLDPSSITITRNNTNQGTAGLTTAATCTGGGFNLNDTTINNAASTVILCTSGAITHNNNAVVNITTAGVGIQFGAANTPSNITFQTGGVTTWSIITNNGPLTFNGPVSIPGTNTVTMNLSTSGGAVTFGSTLNGNGALVVNTGAGTTTFTGAVGGTTPLTNMTFTSAGLIQIGNNITVTGANPLNFSTIPVSLTGPSTINAVNANITFGSTINGAQALTLATGTGIKTFSGAVGGTTPLTSLTVTATGVGTITQSSTVRTSTGSVTYNAASTITIGNNITTTSNGAISITGPVTLGGAVSMDTSAGGGANISFVGAASTINGAQALSLSSGTGAIAIGSTVGATTALTSFSATATGAGTITQSNTVRTSTGNVTYNAASTISINNNITTTTNGAISITGPVSLGGPVTMNTSTGGGANISFVGSTSTINGAQTLTLAAGTGTIGFGGAVGNTTSLTNLIFSSAGLIQLGNNITVSGANPLSFSTIPVSLTGTSVVNSNGNSISFGSTINGAQALTLAAGAGSITLSGVIGGTTPLNSLTISSANNVIATTISAGSLTQSAGTGTTTFNGALNMTSAPGLSLTGLNFTFNGVSTLTGSAAATITQSGTLTINPGANFSLASGSFIQNGAGSNSVGANITSTSGNISFATAINLIGPVALQNTTSGNTTLSGTVNGAQTLNLISAGTVTLSSAIGGTTPLSSLTANAATVTQSSSVKTTGAVSYTGSSAINVGGNITTAGNLISMTGPVTISNSPAFDSTNGGLFPLGANISFSSTLNGATALTLTAGSTGVISFTGAVGNTAPLTNLSFGSASQIQIGNNITVTGANPLSFPDPVSLTGTSVITSNNANINFNSTLDGAQALTLVAGSGSITFTGAVGGTTPLTSLTITSANNVTANAINAGFIVQSSGSGTTTFNGVINTTNINGIFLTGNNFAINNNITTTGGGPLTVNHTGFLVIAPGAVLTLSGGFFDNGSGSGTTNLSGTINTNGQNLTFSNPVQLVGTASLNTCSGVGNILFSSTLNGAQNLTLATCNGNITFTGAVGGTTPIGAVTINSANNVTANAFSAVSFNQTAGTGISTFNGPMILSGASGFSFIGTNLTFNNSLSTALGGQANIQVSNNLILTSLAALSLDGAFAQTGTGSVQMAGSITTTNDNISFTGPVTLSGSTALNTGAGIGNILFSSTVDGPGALTMTAGTGNITLSGAAGSFTRLGAVTINSATNVSTLGVSAASINQAVAATGISTYAGDLNTNAVAGISLNSPTLTVNGNLITTTAGPVSLVHAGTLSLTAGASTTISSTFTESGSGGVNLSGTIVTNNAAVSFANAVALTGTTSINSGALNGSIHFFSTIDGGQNLTLSSGSGVINLDGNVGSGTRLNNVTISIAGNVTANNITAATFTQLNGSGTTTLNGAINTNAGGGVSLSGNNFIVNNTVTTTPVGSFSIANAGTLNLTSGAICSIAGGFTQSNNGAVTLSGQITAGGPIAFSGPITLSGSAVLNTNAASQNITIASTIDGGGNLTLDAGGGNIALQSAVGSNAPIGALIIGHAFDVSTLGIVANSINQQHGTGTSTFSGDIHTNGPSGVTFVVNNLNRSGLLSTSGGGPVTITNSGTYTSFSAGLRTIDGFYLQNGTGPVIFSGRTIQTNNQPISFSSPITLTGDVTLNSGTTGANITLTGTVNGPHALSLAAGTGDISISNIIGGSTPLTSLTFSSAHNITTSSAITANAIVQSAAAAGGLSQFNGTLNALTISGINLTGSAFQFNNTVTTTNAGVFSLNNSGTALFAANFTIDGTFTQSGSGGVSLQASLATTGNSLTIGSAITLTGNSSLSSGLTGTGILTLSSTVDGSHTLSLTSGTGDTVVSGAIGSSSPLTSLTASGNNISVANIGTAGVAGVSGATSLTATSNLNFTGSIYHTTGQTFSAQLANITTGPLTTFNSSGSNIDFSLAPLFLSATANLTINSGNGAITLNNVDAVASSARTVTLNSGSGVITLANVGTLGNGEIGLLSLTSLTGGNMLLHGNLFINSISLTTPNPNTISLGGNITTTGGAITFPLGVNIIRDNVNNATLTTNGGNITFQGKIDGDIALTRSLTIASGSGDVFFNGDIGDTVPLSSLDINSAHNVTTAAVTVGFVSQILGSGTTTFAGQVTTSTVNGLNLVGTNFTFLSGVDTTTNTGVFSVNNSGTLTLNSGVTWNLGDSLIQNGSGPVSLGVHIDAGNAINFASPITLIGTTLLDTAASASQILLGSTVDGGFDLSMTAGTSNIIVNGAIGSTRIGNFVITSAANITTKSISASSINFTWGTGTFSFTGALNTNTPAGIVLTGTNIFSILGTITTSNLGPLTVSTTGTTSGTSGGPTVVSGSITQNSTGTGFLGGSFTSLTGNITTAHNIHLNAPLILDTSTGGGDIIIQGTIDGAFPITFKAGSGNIDLQQPVGAATALGAIVINNANNVTTQSVNAASIQQLTGTGTTTFNGAISTIGATGISIATNSFVRGAAITTTNGGPFAVTISNLGTFTSTAAGVINAAGGFSQSGGGSVAFGGTINASNNNISFAGPIALSADAFLNTGAISGNTTLSSTVQGAHALTISGGAGSVTFGGNVGTAITPLTSVIINNAFNVTTQAITAGFIEQDGGTGTSLFNGALTTSTGAGISLAGSNFTFGNILAAPAGTITVTNSGLATFNVGANASSLGDFMLNGTGPVHLANTITTTNGEIHCFSDITLTGSTVMDSSAGNKLIMLHGFIDGANNLTLTSGSGNITVLKNIGSTRIGNLTLTSSGTVSMQGITAASITQTGTAPTTYGGDLDTNTSTGIHLATGTLTLLGNVTASNTGQIVIANAGTLTTTVGTTLLGDGGFSQTGAGSVDLASNVTANTNNIAFNVLSPIALLANVVLTSGTSTGDITVGTVDGNFNLTFTPGRDIFAGVIGGTTRVGTVTATTARDIHAVNITAGSIAQLAGTGTTTLNGNINTNTPAGISLVGNNFTRGGSIITTNGGSFVVTHTGLITGTSINTTSIDGSYTANGVGLSAAHNLAGTISARTGISISSAITLLSDPGNLTPIILDSSGGNGNITISNTINNDAFAPHKLILRSGGGNVSLNNAIGNTNPIGPIFFGNVNNINAAAITADSIQQEALTTIAGTATFNGVISTTGSLSSVGIVLSSSNINFNNNVTTVSSGPMALTVSNQLALANGVSVSLDGPFSQAGAGSVLMGGSITTTNDNISFASSVTLTSISSLNTNSGIGDITLASINGAFPLTLTAGLGNVSLQGSIGTSTPLSGLTINSAASILANASLAVAGPISLTTVGTLTFNDTVTTTAGGSITLANGGALTITSPIISASSITQTQTGTPTTTLHANLTSIGSMQLASNTTLTNNVIMNSNGGAIILSGTVDSDGTARNLTLTPGLTGTIALNGILGGVNPLAAFQITNGSGVTATNISAATIQQLAGTGLSHFNGTLTTTGLGGVSLIGNQFTLDSAVTTTGNGPLSIVHSSSLTMNSASHSLSGSFTESGGGGVSIGANMTLSDQTVLFSDAVTLTGPTTITSNNGNITFSNSIDGPFCLTLAAGTGTIELDGSIGSLTSLGCLTATGNNIVQNNSITSTGAVQETGAITLNGSITTAASNITLTGNVQVTTDATLTTGTGASGGIIHITGTINPDISTRNLTIQTGTAGTVTLDSSVAGSVALHNFTVNSGTININNFGSTTAGATGTTALTANSNLNFNGTIYTNATQNYAIGATGTINFNAVTPTTITSNGSPITFSTTGTGMIKLNASDLTINSSGGNVTLIDTFGQNRNLTIDAVLGTVTVAHIGTAPQPLNSITVTSQFLNQPFTTFPGIVFNSPTLTSIAANVSSPLMNYTTPVQITADNITFFFSTCPVAHSISFDSTLDSDVIGQNRNVTFDMCGNTLIFNAPVGSTAPLTSITVLNDSGVIINSPMTVGEFIHTTGGTGAVLFNNGLTTVTNAGVPMSGDVNVTAPSITLQGSFNIAGTTTLNNSGALTATEVGFNSVGPFQQTGTGTSTISGAVQSVNNAVSFHGPVTLNGDLTLTASNVSNGNISFDNTIDGGFNLTFTAGRDITTTGAIGGGTRLGIVKAATVRNINAANITAASIVQLAGSGTTTLSGNINTNTVNGINLVGNNFTRSGSIITTSGGSFTVTNTGLITGTSINTTNIDGSYTANGVGLSAAHNLAGTITARTGITITSPITLLSDPLNLTPIILDASSGNGTVTLSNTINNDLLAGHTLILRSGSGNVIVSNPIGNTHPIGPLLFGNVNNITTAAISADSIAQEVATTITGTAAFNGAISTTGSTGIVLTAPQIAFNNNITLAGNGPLTLTHTGLLSFANAGTVSISGTGAFSESGGGSVSLAGTMTTASQSITFGDAVNLTGSTILSTLSSGTGANISFGSTLNGAQSLDLTAGNGSITFTGSVGSSSALGPMTIHSVTGITYPSVTASSITQLGNSGLTTINGPILTSGTSGISLTGTAFTQNGTITTTLGGFTITHSGTFNMNPGSGATISGSYTDSLSSTGAVSARGAISAGGSIAFNSSGAVTLAASTTLNSGLTSGGITFRSTVDGANNLTLNPNGNPVQLSANVGIGTRLGTLTINSPSSFDAQKIAAGSLVQTSGSGTTHFHDTVDVTSDISLGGSGFTFDNTLNASSGSITITNTGLATFNVGANVSLLGAGDFMLNGTGPVHLANNITTINGEIDCFSNITVTGTTVMDSSTSNKSITLHGFIDGATPGANNLSLTSGSGNISLLQNIGSFTRVGNLSLASTGTVTMQGINAASISQTGSAATTYNADLNTNTVGGIHLTTGALTFLGNVAASTTGPIVIANGGTLVTTVGTTLFGDGGFSQTGAGSVSLASNVSATNNNITFNTLSPITLLANVILNSGTSLGDITVGTVDGNFNLTFTPGRDIFAGAIGGTARVGTVTATTVRDNHASSIKAGAIVQLAGTGTTTLNGNIDTDTPQGITLVGNNFVRSGSIITTNSGSFIVTHTGLITGTSINTTSISGSYTANGVGGLAAHNLAGAITANTGITITSPITLFSDPTNTVPIVLDTSGGNGPISLASAINNDTISGMPHHVVINAGTGTVTVSSAIGSTTAIGDLKITGSSVSINNVGTALTPGLTGALQIPDPLSLVTPSQITFTGPVVNGHAQSYTALTSFNMNAGSTTTISSNGQPVTFTTGKIQLAANTNLTINSANGNITTADIHAGAASLRSLILNAGTGAVQVGIIGLAGNGEFASVSLTGVLNLPNNISANAITFSPVGTMSVGGNLTTVGTALSFPTALTLTGSRTFSTSGGTITFTSTLDSDAILTPRSLILAAGAGDVIFSNTVGGTFPLNALTIANARNVTATAAGASLTLGSFAQAAGSGTTEFSRAVSTSTSGGFQFSGNNLQFDNTSTLTTTSNGPMIIANTGIFTFAGTANLSAGLSQLGTGGVALSGSITAGQPVSFAAPVNLTGTPSIDTSLNGESITFSRAVNGPGGLTLTAGGGDIAMNGTIGGTTPLGAVTIASANNITLQSLTASSLTFTTFSGTANYQTITTTGNVTFNGNNFIRNGSLNIGGSLNVTNAGFIRGFNTNTTSIVGSYTQFGPGPYELAGSITVGMNISLASAITLSSNTSLTSTGNGIITLSNTVDGNQNLTLAVGSGTINLNGNIGTTNPIGALTISSAGAVSTQGINAVSITQTTGSGTTTFNGDLNTSGTSGINLNGVNFVRGGNWTTTNTGPISITIPLGGTFTSTSVGTINSAGSFHQFGSGSVSLSRTINTSSTAIVFAGPVSLAGTTTLNTGGVGPGDIAFSSTLDGASDLFLTAGTGSILMQGAVGGTTRLGNITVNNANNVTAQALKVASFSQLSGNGTTTLNGPTDINTATGISIIGTGVALNGTLTTSFGGVVTINNSGVLNVGATCSVAGNFTQIGSGPSVLSGSITSTSGLISFSGAVSTSGTPQLTTSSQPITFSSTVDGPSIGTGNLTLNSGIAGDISFIGAIGSINRLGNLLISDAHNVSMQNITAGSITQSTSAATGLTSIIGSINTSNGAGINLIGHGFTINGSIITTNGGPMTINHSGLLTLNAGPSTLIAGPFTENGTGSVLMSGNLHTNSADITFNTPVILLNPTILNSDGTGDITLNNTFDGATDLTLDAGTNTIIALAPIGGITPLTSLTIVDAGNATFNIINAGTITELNASGLTTFNGVLATSTFNGIQLSGNAFAFNAPVTTTGNGQVIINNRGNLTISAVAPMNLTGPFSQIGMGSVTLSANITIDNDAILFTGPVTLGNTVSLTTNTAQGNLTFLNTLDGTQNLNIAVGVGSITFSSPVGGFVELGALTVTSATDFTSQAITATSINLSGIIDLATFGALTTTSFGGIILNGDNFTFNQDVVTTTSGPLTITNNGTLTFSPAHTVTIDGPFNQNGTGLVRAGGNLVTDNQTVDFSSPVFLNGNYSINTGTIGANVTFGSDLDGPFSLVIAAGVGDVTAQKAIGDGGALQSITITSAHNINLNGVGTASAGDTGVLSLTASNLINLNNGFYTSGSQVYSAGTGVHFINGAITNLMTTNGPISFTSGPITLSSGNDLTVVTNNGAFSYVSIAGTTFENLTVSTGTGPALMNTIIGPHINNVFVHAGQVEFIGSINDDNADFESLGPIFNLGSPVAINSVNTAFFNALNGDVGTLSSPILVNTSNQIFAGAGGRPDSLADFNGTSADNTVHVIVSNPPCEIIFNSVIIKNCTVPPTPPTPPTPPGPAPIPVAIAFPFAVPGFDSSFFNLASDYFFFPYFFDESYVCRFLDENYTCTDAPIYWRSNKNFIQKLWQVIAPSKSRSAAKMPFIAPDKNMKEEKAPSNQSSKSSKTSKVPFIAPDNSSKS